MFEFFKKPRALQNFMNVALLMTDETVADWVGRPHVYGPAVHAIVSMALEPMLEHHSRWGTEPSVGEMAGAVVQFAPALNSKGLTTLTDAVALWTLVGDKDV